MKTAIITDSSAYLSDDIRNKNNVFVLDVPVFIAGETYIEGKNLTVQAFYDKMAVTEELPKTSQPSISDLVTLLENYRLTATHTSLVSFYHQAFQDFGKIFNI